MTSLGSKSLKWIPVLILIIAAVLGANLLYYITLRESRHRKRSIIWMVNGRSLIREIYWSKDA